jgi:hypothetical protein
MRMLEASKGCPTAGRSRAHASTRLELRRTALSVMTFIAESDCHCNGAEF